MWIASAETFIRANFDTRKQSLGIMTLNTCLFQLRRPELIIEQRGRDEVSQVVVALLLHLWMVLGTEGPTACEFESPLENVALHALNVCGRQAIPTLQIEHSLQHR